MGRTDASLGPSKTLLQLFCFSGGKLFKLPVLSPPQLSCLCPPPRALYGMVLGADDWLTVSIAAQARNLEAPTCLFVLFSQVEGSQGWEMQSTTNYLWSTDDLLGQGATASVYKARNKVIATLASDPFLPWSKPSLGH